MHFRHYYRNTVFHRILVANTAIAAAAADAVIAITIMYHACVVVLIDILHTNHSVLPTFCIPK